MKRAAIVIPPIVEEQILAQVLYIARDSVDNALAWEARLRAAIEGIGHVPLGHPVDNVASRRLGETVRKMVFERAYLVHYRLNETTNSVEILNFRHGARLARRGEA